MSTSGEQFDYPGSLVIIETQTGEIVFIHPPGAPAEARASLPSNPCARGEAPADGAAALSSWLVSVPATGIFIWPEHGRPETIKPWNICRAST